MMEEEKQRVHTVCHVLLIIRLSETLGTCVSVGAHEGTVVGKAVAPYACLAIV